MTTLSVTTTKDFSADSLSGIDIIDFNSADFAVTATFADDQFNSGSIEADVTIDGSLARDTVHVNVSTFLIADTWQFANWTKFDKIVFEGNAGFNILLGTSKADTMNGGDGDDRLNGGPGFDTYNGGAGDDELTSFSGEGADALDGGADTDLAIISRTDSGVNFTLDIAAGGGGLNIGDGTTVKNIESFEFYAGTGNDSLGGGGLDDVLDGADGNDTLTGRGGADSIDGGEGDDILSGGEGDDSIHPGGGTNIVNGDAGDDSIYANIGESASAIDGGDGIDFVDIGRGGSTIGFVLSIANGGSGKDIGDGTTLVNVELLNFQGGSGKDKVTGGSLDDTFVGGGGNDVLKGGGGIDHLDGEEGNDLIEGNTGIDLIEGNEGNDVIEGGAGADKLDGGDGKDTLSYVGSKASVEIDLGDGTAAGGDAQGDTIAGFENVTGGSGADDLSGSATANTILGGKGNDALAGRGAGDDLQGGEGSDLLYAGGGADTLSGGAGRDFLFGGRNADSFAFAATSESGASAAARDVILDFVKGSDKIDLSAIDAKDGSGTANDTFAFVPGEGAAFTGVAGQVAFFFSGSSTIIALDTDGDAAADSQIELAAQVNLAAGDFVL